MLPAGDGRVSRGSRRGKVRKCNDMLFTQTMYCPIETVPNDRSVN